MVGVVVGAECMVLVSRVCMASGVGVRRGSDIPVGVGSLAGAASSRVEGCSVAVGLIAGCMYGNGYIRDPCAMGMRCSGVLTVLSSP